MKYDTRYHLLDLVWARRLTGESLLVFAFSLLEKHGDDIISMRQTCNISLLEREEENTDKLFFCLFFLIIAFDLKHH